MDPSNMSPIVRDVGQVLLDDDSTLHELWAGPRRQWRWHDEQATQLQRCPAMQTHGWVQCSRERFSRQVHTPMSRACSHWIVYPPINPSTSTFPMARRLHPGSAPALPAMLIDAQYRTSGNKGHGSRQQRQQSSLPTWFTPGKDLGYYPSRCTNISRAHRRSISTISARASLLPYWRPRHCTSSGSKAGCTDMFHLTDLTLGVRVGGLVIVEADRGKDLGTVVNGHDHTERGRVV
ncbi:hypothetical protein SCLCIDRAFT_776012 [Scleroderma citrinum Foug A]|uniref:Uncharacterized protein n=1 Tax=Scleroderma citrinum Foug A TaxID=1036808 RepID=A0A0C2YLQ2_9AGAM|nr:hypothetical protein SCLCIDRAFT_776012 [Scleroderma citrinum Foug A]